MQNNQLTDRNITKVPLLKEPASTTSPGYRYTILALLFLATCINYIDRQIIGLLKPILEEEFRWSETDYADIVFWFQVLYAAGYYINGRWIDVVGAKMGYGLSVLFWSLAAVAHGFVQTLIGFKVVRAALGFFEASNFPAAVKVITEWFPKEERAFATGVMISGTTIGAALAPGLVLWLADRFGWQTSFWVAGSLGLLWVVVWIFLYQRPIQIGKKSTQDKAFITYHPDVLLQTTKKKKFPPTLLFKKKATWGLIWATFLTDHVWWFYLFWLPSYLAGKGLSKTEIALPLTFVYLITAIFSIISGWCSSHFVKRGWSLNRTRKATMFCCVLMVSSVALFRFYDDVWLCTIIISIAAAAQSIWKASLLTSVADLFPNKLVSTVQGIVGLAGAIGGMMVIKAVGYLLDYYKQMNKLENGYHLIFLSCSGLFFLAFVIFHLLSPTLKRVEM